MPPPGRGSPARELTAAARSPSAMAPCARCSGLAPRSARSRLADCPPRPDAGAETASLILGAAAAPDPGRRRRASWPSCGGSGPMRRTRPRRRCSTTGWTGARPTTSSARAAIFDRLVDILPGLCRRLEPARLRELPRPGLRGRAGRPRPRAGAEPDPCRRPVGAGAGADGPRPAGGGAGGAARRAGRQPVARRAGVADRAARRGHLTALDRVRPPRDRRRPAPAWWNGRHRGLKIPWPTAVPVRVRPRAPRSGADRADKHGTNGPTWGAAGAPDRRKPCRDRSRR